MKYFIHDTSIVERNCKIGKGTKIWHWTHISKNVSIGRNCVLGQNVFIGESVRIGDNVKIQGQSGVTSNIKDEMKIQGTPAFSYNDYNKSYVYFKNLPNLGKEINSILKKLKL